MRTLVQTLLSLETDYFSLPAWNLRRILHFGASENAFYDVTMWTSKRQCSITVKSVTWPTVDQVGAHSLNGGKLSFSVSVF